MIALSKKNKKNENGIVLDIDALIMENRYLQERLNQAIAEKELATATMSKYKVPLIIAMINSSLDNNNNKKLLSVL